MTQSSRTLLAVINARHRKEWRSAIRSTWLSQVPQDKADAFFFVGRGETLEDPQGVVELDCSDKYEHLPEKIKSLCKWTLEKGYSNLLKTDDDTLLKPNSFLSSGYEKYQYSGRSNRPESTYAIPFGFGYVLDRRCMEIIAGASLPSDGSNDDEKWVACNLYENRIFLQDDRRYYLHTFPIDPLVPTAKRPLRAPKRDKSTMQAQFPVGTFSLCVHIAAELEDKIKEYKKLWERYGETH